MNRLPFGIGDFLIELKEQKATVKGDTPGHEFHGNQYSAGGGSGGGESESSSGSSSDSAGSSGGKASRTYEKTPQGRNQKLNDLKEDDVISHGGKDYDVLNVKKQGGKQNRHDVTVKPHGEPRRKLVEGRALNKGKMIEVDNSRTLTFYNTGGDYSADHFSFK